MEFLAILSIFLSTEIQAHVALTFPPARKYDLDFLDTFRTDTPCGMPKGDIKTSIPAGQSLNVQWHLGYPHNGGFKIELLDANDEKIKDLTSPGSFEGTADKTAQNFNLVMPTETCNGCSIRLIRQALEWGPNYLFQSCANVDIVNPNDYVNDCSGHGTASGSTCQCKKFYHGNKCQFRTDCETDTDCNSHGQCVGTAGTALPRDECYCDLGFFGRYCEKTSVLNKKFYNESLYMSHNLLGTDVRFLWRFVDEAEHVLEAIVVGKTNSFLAIGWRPDNVDKSCQAFPLGVPRPKGNDFHDMDCQDVVIGKAKGSQSNIGDYYTRDRSTPRRDALYGGQDNLEAAAGWEENGVTTIMFRRDVSTDSPADHDFDGKLKLIWAHGQDGNDFYKQDELKYHGGNRGSMTLQIGPEGISDSRQMTLIGILLILGLMGIQAIQNVNEGILCCGQKTQQQVHSAIGLDRLS